MKKIFVLLLALMFVVPQIFTGFMWLLTILAIFVTVTYIVFLIIRAREIDFDSEYNEDRFAAAQGSILESEIHLTESKQTARF